MTLNILWWVAFFVFGLALQQALPGTDVLVAGLFLALQERRPFQLAVVLLALILVQEGVGTLDFGTEITRSVSGTMQFHTTGRPASPLTDVFYAGCPDDDFEVCLAGIPRPAERREAERLARLRRGADSMRRDRA